MRTRIAGRVLFISGTISVGTTAGKSSCYEPGSCPAAGASSQGATGGFTNVTGWMPNGEACCDICDGSKKVNCFDPSTCGQKTGNNDWDFLVFDQIYLPQFCVALEQGHDPTVTHLPGTRCRNDSAYASVLSIHGLWPNYINGYPQCCKHVKFPQEMPAELKALARQRWIDPTRIDGDPCGVCSMWSHEMMKHGSCFSADVDGYFSSALGLSSSLLSKTDQANQLLNSASKRPVLTSELERIYAPYTMQILCDAKDSKDKKDIGVFLELRTCWNRTKDFRPESASASDLVQINCTGKAVGNRCPEYFITSEFSASVAVAEPTPQIWA